MDGVWWKGLPVAPAGSGYVRVNRQGVGCWRPNDVLLGHLRAFKGWAGENRDAFILGLSRAESWRGERVTLELLRGLPGTDRFIRPRLLARMTPDHPAWWSMTQLMIELGLDPADCEPLAEPAAGWAVPPCLHLQVYPTRRREQARIREWLERNTHRLRS